MRMILPSRAERRLIHRHLQSFFRDHRELDFKRAVTTLARFYHLKSPRVHWFEYLDWGKSAGKTYEDGEIHLVHPENWKHGRKYNSEKQWINVVYHEMGHYVLWADHERKANAFAVQMEKDTPSDDARLKRRPPARVAVGRKGSRKNGRICRAR